MDHQLLTAQERLLGRPLTEGETRAMAAQVGRLAVHVVATALAPVGSLFGVEPAAHAALVARLGQETPR